MNKQYFILAHEIARNGAKQAIDNAPDGYVVEISEPNRTKDQNALLHSILQDISLQVVWHGQKFKLEIWKRLCVAAWLREEKESPLLVPALDGCGVDVIYEKTSKMSVKQISKLIEWCYMFGAENGVKFSK